MTVYAGERNLNGAWVTADGMPLDPKFAIETFCKARFEWTYRGDGPRQLAFALLAHHLGDDERALAVTGLFMRHAVSRLHNVWRLKGTDTGIFLGQQVWPETAAPGTASRLSL